MTKRVVAIIIGSLLLAGGAVIAIAGGALIALFGASNTLSSGTERAATPTCPVPIHVARST